MSELLPQQAAFRIVQTSGAISKKTLNGLDHLVVVVPRRPSAATWRGVPDGGSLAKLAQRTANSGDRALRSRLHNTTGTGITLGRLGPEKGPQKSKTRPGPFEVLKFAGELLADALADQPRSLGLLVTGFPQQFTDEILRALLLAAGAHHFRLPDFRGTRKKRRRELRQITLLGGNSRLDPRRISAEIEAANLVRWLTALPPNRLTAGTYRELVSALAEHHDWSMRFLDIAALRSLGAGAFLAVAQGNATQDAGVVHLSYRPAGAGRPDVALIGKGIIFDTGGTNLKSFKSMLDMHQDMNGSAVALGVLLAISELRLPIAVDCWLAITENRISAEAYKSRDVVHAANGVSIEVIHTDAEGRMALADTLVLAGREKPGLMIDFATLTGACVHALTERYSGVFSNRPQLNEILVAAGRASGERVWAFPMDEDYDEELKSTVADVQQCSADNDGDQILAARFLQRFVPEGTPWVHLDLSAAARKKGLAQVPGGPTGFGVRYTLNLLVEHGTAVAAAIGAIVGA